MSALNPCLNPACRKPVKIVGDEQRTGFRWHITCSCGVSVQGFPMAELVELWNSLPQPMSTPPFWPAVVMLWSDDAFLGSKFASTPVESLVVPVSREGDYEAVTINGHGIRLNPPRRVKAGESVDVPLRAFAERLARGES